MALKVPGQLAANCRKRPERAAWLDGLPDALRNLERQWSLTLGAPFDHEEASCAWVAPVALADGSSAVLKLGMQHMEGEHELQGLRFWDGDPTVRLLEADDELGAMLLERCEPGTVLTRAAGVRAGCGDLGATASPLARAISTAPLSPSVGYDGVLE